MLQARAKQNEQTQDPLSGVVLMADEQVRGSLAGSAGDRNNLLLTDRRVIHIVGEGSNMKASYAAVDDISAVEITRQSVQGYSAYIWAVLAFFVAAMLWRVIENETLSLVAAGIVALMGVYLIADRILTRGEHALVFKAGGAEIQYALRGTEEQSDAEALITKLFELKDERGNQRYVRAKTFSPR